MQSWEIEYADYISKSNWFLRSLLNVLEQVPSAESLSFVYFFLLLTLAHSDESARLVMWFSMAWQEANLTTKNYWFFLSELSELPGGWAVAVGYSTKDVFRVPNLGNPSPTLLRTCTHLSRCPSEDVGVLSQECTTCIRNTYEICLTLSVTLFCTICPVFIQSMRRGLNYLIVKQAFKELRGQLCTI